jgi:hypothetical protein
MCYREGSIISAGHFEEFSVLQLQFASNTSLQHFEASRANAASMLQCFTTP